MEVKIIRKEVIVLGVIIAIILLICSPTNAEDVLENQTTKNTTEPVIITESNFQDYFDDKNSLNSSFENKTIVLEGEFDDLGVVNIDAKNVTIIGTGETIITNTVFSINKDYVTLTNITMNLSYAFEENDYSAIYIFANDVSINNINMYYVVPRDVSACGICAEYRKNVKLINNTIYFEAHNDYNGSDYAIKLEGCDNPIIDGNTLISSFPLRLINFETGGVNHVAGICMEYCDNFQLTHNNLTVDVNKRPLSAYPTLVGVRIVGSNKGIVKNNNLSMEDFVTPIGAANYLYGIDVHTLQNLSIDSNNISIRTVGGILAAGTAYGIQLTGPLSEISITNNDIYSISNGPNLGIYSQNYFGDTALDISNNTINITGLAGKHEWALVAGIEVQDSNDNIKNNRIEVHSVGEVDEEDNLYGISYRQNTDGDHTFKVENNLIFSEGYYAVYLLSSVDSTIKNNMLVTSREDAPDKTLEGYKEGPKEHIGDTFYNNTVVNEYTYWSKILNTIEGGEDTTYITPENVNNRSNTVDGKFVDPDNNGKPNYNTNPTKPGNGTKPVKPTQVDPGKDNPAAHGSEDGDGTNDFTNSTTKGGVDDYTNSSSKKELDDYTNPTKDKSKEDYTKTSESENVDLTDKEVKENWEDYTNHDTNSDSDWKDYTEKQANSQKQSTDGTFVDNSDKPQDNGISLPDSKVPSNMTSNTEGGQAITNSNNGEVIGINSTTPSATGESAKSKEKTSESSNSETSSPSASGAVSPSNAYEVTKSITDHPQTTNMLIPIVLGLIILALLIFGYRRKSDYEDY